jgi:pyruvate/2-oxoglutarate/acetoin dehydrogenase E1 component
MALRSSASMIEAARTALDERMHAEAGVVVLGEDVVEGGPFGLTKGLAERHGNERLRNTPISEAAVMGAAIGLALGEKRPFVDLMFNDFMTVASDQLFNHAAKIRFMSGGRYSIPLVVWTVGGAGTRWGAQHSQRLDGWFAQVPGLKVLAPSTPAAAYAAVTEAIADPDPVVVLADRSLLFESGGLPGDERIDPWRARRVLDGDRLTVVATGRLVHLARDVALAADLSVDLLDVQCIAPLDIQPILESLERTARILIVHDEAGGAGAAATLAAAVYEQGFWLLDAPVGRLTSPATPVPAAAGLEDAFCITAEKIESAMRSVLEA